MSLPEKLLFFDIDGTLFDDERRLPASVPPALRRARERSCGIIINTGRTYCNGEPRLDEMGVDGWSMGCGTRVILGGRTLRALEYDAEQSRAMLEVFRKAGMPTVYECDTAMYFDPQCPPHPAAEGFRAFADQRGISRDIREGDPEFRCVKMFVFGEEKRMKALLDSLRDLGAPYEAIPRGDLGWELVPEGCSKALGIELVRKALGVPLENCYAFGDSENDLSMLCHVPHGVAMGNAPEEVKARCAYVTDRPEEDGIAHALERLGLI